jgi:hypothetical protein
MVREQNLPDLHLSKSLEQKELNENRWNRSFQPTLWLLPTSTADEEAGVTLFPSS